MSRQNHIFTKIRAGSQAEMLADRLSKRTEYKTGRVISTIAELENSAMGLRICCMACKTETLHQGREMCEKFGAQTLLKDITTPCGCGSKAVSRIPQSI